MAVFPAVFGLLMAALVTGQNVDIEPRQAVVNAGDTLEVLCKVPYHIDSCRMTVGTDSYILRPGQADGDVIYFGQGLHSGQCGVHLRNIKESWNGNITCVIPPETGSIENTATMRLIVAKPPLDPVLISSSEPAFKEGEVYMGQCVVAGGRPAATIKWLLDDIDLLRGVHQPVLTSEPGSDLQTISQNISMTLNADDGGKTISCRAEHKALQQPKLAKRQLIVYYPPKVESNSITIFGLQLNAEGRLNVSVRAQPEPTVEWRVEGNTLRAPARSLDGRFTAVAPLSTGNGYYDVTLIIDQIRKEDVGLIYHLNVSNPLGYEQLTVRISTMEEPAGVELETGAIVGIVIAVLVLLIAISLVVFAFATDRWCFAGRRRDTTKSSGESDTESAVGGKERSRLAQLSARVRAALPRAKDRVQATDAAPQEDDDKQAEDKVVYATLALSEQTPAEKPPPAFAEYAEIVYTDQGQKDVKETA